MSDSPEFLIEGILPANEVHLLGGSSGSGKTTFAFQVFLAQWQKSEDFLGHKSHPVPYVYVSLDRSRSSVARTLQRLGLTDEITRIVCQEEVPEEALTIEPVLKEAIKTFPDSKLVIIEGFQLLAGEKGNGYTSVGRVLKKAARLCSKYHLTIMGICHSPKMKIDEGFQHPREMIMGSVSWGAYSDTIITLNLDEMTAIITVHLMPRNGPSEKHELRFGENGKLEPYIRAGKKDSICLKIASLPEGRPITREEILRWGQAFHVSSRTCEAAIKTCLENNLLDVIGNGIYERTSATPFPMGQDPDVSIEE